MTDREKLMELIFNGARCVRPDPYETCNGCKYEKDSRCDLSRLADYLLSNGVTIADKTAAVEKPQWIPFDITKPIDGQSVMGITSEGEMAVYQFDADWKACLCQYGGLSKTFNVTHWMPLPEPPKEE